MAGYYRQAAQLVLDTGVRMTRSAGGGLGFELNVRSNSDDPHNQTGVTGRVRGGISVEPEIDFQFSLGLFSGGPSLSFTAAARVEATLEGHFAAYVKSTLIDEELAKVEFKCQTVTIGPVPIVLCPVFTLSAKLTAEGSLALTFAGGYRQAIGARTTYDGSWHTDNITSAPEKDFTATLEPQVKVTLAFPANMTVLLYDIAGPGLSLVPFLTFTARPTDTPWATLDLGVALELTFKIPALELDKSIPLGSLQYRLWDTGGPYDGLTTTPAVTDVRILDTRQFTAQRFGCAGSAPITWSLGPGAKGSINSNGFYRAPLLTDDVGSRDTVIATQAATADCPAKTAEAIVHIGATKPSSARDLTVTADGAGFRLDWSPPASDGGAPIIEYAVIVDDHFLVGHRHVKWHTLVTGVVADATYATIARDTGARFTVVARNAAGWSTLTGDIGLTD